MFFLFVSSLKTIYKDINRQKQTNHVKYCLAALVYNNLHKHQPNKSKLSMLSMA